MSNSLNDAKELYDPETASSSGLSHVPSQPMSIASPRGSISREVLPAAWYAELIGYIRTPAVVFGNSRNLTSAPCVNCIFEYKQNLLRIREKWIEKRPSESCNSHTEICKDSFNLESSLSRRIRLSAKLHGWVTEKYRSQNCIAINSLILRRFQRWKMNFKTWKSCSCSGCPSKAVLWIEEAGVANWVDDLMTSQSRRWLRFPNFEMLDAKIASALTRIMSNPYFQRRINVEEQEARTQNRFLRGRLIAYMIYEHFRVTGAYEAALDLTDLFSVSLQGLDTQDFDTKCDHSCEVCTTCEYRGSSTAVRPEQGNWSKSIDSKATKSWRPLVRRHISSNDQNAKLQSQDVKGFETRVLVKSQEGKNVSFERWNGRMLSVESKKTVFNKRPPQFPQRR